MQFSTEADKSTLFLVAPALDSSIAGVPLMPHQFLSAGGVLTLCRGEEQDRQSWKPCPLFHLPRLGRTVPEQACEQTLVVPAFREMIYFFLCACKPSLSQQQCEQTALLESSLREEGLLCQVFLRAALLPEACQSRVLRRCRSSRRLKSLIDAKIARSEKNEIGFRAAAEKQTLCNKLKCS